MCGRLVHTITADGYATYLDLSVPEVEPNYDVRPTDPLPVIRMGEEGLECALLRWGFPARGTKVLFNARLETAAELPSFRDAYRRRRALVFTSGWYEWRDRQQFWIRRRDGKPTVMAALWQGDRFAILTAGATGELAAYHHRMPVLLLERDWKGWTAGELCSLDRPWSAYPSRVLIVSAVVSSLEVNQEVNQSQNPSPGGALK